MKRINIREALLNMDKATDCEFDLTSLYEACCLDDKKKEKLVQYIDAYDIDATNKFLSNEATSQGLMEEVADDLSDDELKDIMGEAVVHMTDETTFNPLVRTQSLKVGDMVYDEDTGHKCKVLNIINDGKYSKQIALGDTVNQRTYTQISGNNALWEVAVEGDTAHEVDDDVDIELHSPTELMSEEVINEELWDTSRANELVTYYLDGGDYATLELCYIIMNQMKEEGRKLPYNITDFFDTVYKAVYEYNKQFEDGPILESVSWNSLNGAEQSAAEKAVQSIQYNGTEVEYAVQRACSEVGYGNVEPEYEDEDFYGEEADYYKVLEYVKSQLNESYTNDLKPGDTFKAKMPSGHIFTFTVDKVLPDAYQVKERTKDGDMIYKVNKSQVISDTEPLKEYTNWTDAFHQFSSIVDKVFTGGNAEEVNKEVEALYRKHEGEPAWDEAWKRWTDTEDLDESTDVASPSITDYKDELELFLRDKHFSFEFDIPRDDTLVIDIEGDWKHDHLYLDTLVRDFFADKGLTVISYSYVTEEDGSDYYRANHCYKFDAPMEYDATVLPLKESIEVGSHVTHIDDAEPKRGIVYKVEDGVATVCVGGNPKDIVEVPLDKLQLDEGILGDLGKVVKAGAKAIGNKITNTKTYQKIKPTVDKVVDKVKNNDVVKSVVDTAKQTQTATRIKDAKDVRGVQANIKAARSAEDIAAVEAQVYELQSSGKLHTNNHMNYLMKQLGDRKKQLGIKDEPTSSNKPSNSSNKLYNFSKGNTGKFVMDKDSKNKLPSSTSKVKPIKLKGATPSSKQMKQLGDRKKPAVVTESLIGEIRDIFCVDCDTVTSQTYKGSFKDGYHTLGRYICTRCGCENNDEVLEEDINLDSVVTVGIYGDEDNSLGIASMDELVNYFQKKGIEVISKDGDMDYGWDLGLRGNPRDIFLAVNNNFTGYNCSSVQEFVDQYQVDDDFFSEAVATRPEEGDGTQWYVGDDADIHKNESKSIKESISETEIASVLNDARDNATDFGITDEFTNEYYIGQSVSAFGYPLEKLFIFLPDHISEEDKEYQDAVKGWKENEQIYESKSIKESSEESDDLKFVDNRKKSIISGDPWDDPGFDEYDINESSQERVAMVPSDDTVDLEYSDLTVTYDTRPSNWNMWTDGDDWEEHERKMDYTLTVDKEDVITFLIEECVSEDDVPNMSQMSDDEFEQYVVTNFDKLFTTYEQIIKDEWEEEATERATEHYLDNKDYYDEPDYELMYGDE